MNGQEPDPKIITRLLDEASTGSQKAAGELFPLVYKQLRALAANRMAGERVDHTLQATALVHEAYLRLVGARQTTWKGKGQFCLAAAEAMRRILIDHARKRGRIKRGGDYKRVPLDIEIVATHAQPEEITALIDAIGRLEKKDSRTGEIVRLRFFVGLSVAETAAALGLSDRTVRRDWALARAWLYRELKDIREETGCE